jgi:hypothetical protein
MEAFLILVTALAWTAVYVEAVRIGFRQKTHAIPALAIGLNFASESMYAVYDAITGVYMEAAVNAVWAAADVLIIVTLLRSIRKTLAHELPEWMLIAGLVLLFAVSYSIQGLFAYQFGVHWGSRYCSFLQNILMSALFIWMPIMRRGLEGQSLVIAVGKCIGTLAATMLVGVREGSFFVAGLGALCFVLDAAYIGIVTWFYRRFDRARWQGH